MSRKLIVSELDDVTLVAKCKNVVAKPNNCK